MLRRTKDQTLNGEKLIELPARNVNVVSCEFDSAEQEFYTALETKMEAVLQKLMASDTGNRAYMSVLLLLLRLRQGKRTCWVRVIDQANTLDSLQPSCAGHKGF